MNSNNYLVEEVIKIIENKIDKKVLEKIVTKANTAKKKAIYFIIFGVVLLVIAPIFGLFIPMGNVLMVILILGGIACFIFSFKKFSKSKDFKWEITNGIQKIDWTSIYLETVNKIQKPKDFILKDIQKSKNKSFIKKYRGSPASYLNNNFAYNLIGKQDKFLINYKGKDLEFEIGEIIKTIETYTTTDSKGNTTTHYVYHYINFYHLILNWPEFCNEFNGLYFKYGKTKSKSGNWVTESIDFNKKYFINVKDNDLKGPKFFRPKTIDYLNNIPYDKCFNGLFIVNNQIYVSRAYAYKTDYDLPINYFSNQITNSKDIVKSIAIKILYDIDLVFKSLVFLKSIY